MQYFTQQKSITNIERQVYNGANTLSSMTTTGVTATGYLRPLTEEQQSNNGMQYGTGFSLIVETSIDIREGDRLTISGSTYTVKGVVNHDRGGVTAYKRCLLLKPQS